jgi:hypothetical protein
VLLQIQQKLAICLAALLILFMSKPPGPGCNVVLVVKWQQLLSAATFSTVLFSLLQDDSSVKANTCSKIIVL